MQDTLSKVAKVSNTLNLPKSNVDEVDKSPLDKNVPESCLSPCSSRSRTQQRHSKEFGKYTKQKSDDAGKYFIGSTFIFRAIDEISKKVDKHKEKILKHI